MKLSHRLGDIQILHVPHSDTRQAIHISDVYCLRLALPVDDFVSEAQKGNGMAAVRALTLRSCGLCHFILPDM